MSQPDAAPIYEVRAETPNGQIHSYGVRRTRVEADVLLRETSDSVGKHHTRCWVEEIDTTGFFVVPPTPKPRDRFTTRVIATNKLGSWPKTHVEVLDGDRIIAAYDRNYTMLRTFEPFRQNDRMFALISTDYTATSVMDLHTGQIVAAEEPHTSGFCPVGFYVPDWWDVHNGLKLPGSMYWRPLDDEWPTGDFGFVWGCVWGDDSSWKVQYLDLSRVGDGIIRRDDRFGYLKVATDPELVASHFIRCSSWQGERRVEFHVPRGFNLTTGTQISDEDW